MSKPTKATKAKATKRSAKRRAPSRARRTALGDLNVPDLGSYSPDQAALALKSVPCGACRMGKYEHICPACNERVASRPSSRLTCLNLVASVLDGVRVNGAVERDLAAAERMAITMLIGTCDECTRAIHERRDRGKAA